ncbi:MAG: glycine cleavage system aminomethyltransferase GcvT [Endomicrobiales bacterium]|nr:glycine cleavage system aminomethyltransferase GcvT [Endomicrobiales bacterium]
MQKTEKKLKQTPLYHEHKKLNARFVDFGGWDMPVIFTSILDEHNTVRNNCGLFDASHMGEFIVSGKNSADFLNKLTTANIPGLKTGEAKYTLFLNENGGIIDDLIVYRRENDFFVVVNAANLEKDFSWLQKHKSEGVNLENISDKTSLIAFQGPNAEKILQPLLKEDLKKLNYFNFLKPSFNFISPQFAILARTGYTGEDGFEIFVSNDSAVQIWQKLLSLGAKACGLGARDSLRLEAAMSLHGHDITENTTPIEAGLSWTIYWDKDFIGKNVIKEQKEKGPARFLKAFILETGIPRENCDIILDSKIIGKVTSGTFSPTLKKGICLGYINQKLDTGKEVKIMVHNQPRAAKVVKKPFYKRHR